LLEWFGLVALVRVVANPFCLIEFFWDLLALFFELSCFFHLVIEELLDILSEFESKDPATFLLESDWIWGDHADLWLFGSCTLDWLFLGLFVLFRRIRVLIVGALVDHL